jgi:hypothetical protein
MRTKTLVVFRSKSIDFKEGKMESVPIPPSHTVRELSVVTEEHIQALATRGLLRPKEEVSWRTATGEEFPTEGLDRRLLPRPSLLLSD